MSTDNILVEAKQTGLSDLLQVLDRRGELYEFVCVGKTALAVVLELQADNKSTHVSLRLAVDGTWKIFVPVAFVGAQWAS